MNRFTTRFRALGLLLLASCAALAGFGETMVTDGFAKKIDFTFTGYAGSTALTNFPALIKLNTDITGFSYDDFSSTDGSDLRFVDADTNEIPYEIDTWNPSGTSLVWVKVPELTATTKITAYYGGSGSSSPAIASTNVWTAYAGVWHLSESGAGGTSADATVNAINGTNAACTSGRVDGVIGNCRRITDKTDQSAGGGITVPGFAALNIVQPVSISTWMRHNPSASLYWDHVFYNRLAASGTTGFAVEFYSSNWKLAVHGSSTAVQYSSGLPGTEWVLLELVYSNDTCTVYANGAKLGNPLSVATVTASTYALAFGCCSPGGKDDINFKGDFDEMRVASGAFSADWTRAEYDTVQTAAFCSNGVVVVTDESAPIFTAAPVVAWNGTDWTFSAALASGEGAVYSIVGSVTNALSEGIVSEPQSWSVSLADLSTDTVYAYGVRATNALGSIAFKTGTNTFLNGEVSVVKGDDADELDLTKPATFIVSRPNGENATALPLTVSYTLGGTAVAGVNYTAPSSFVTIPAGTNAAVVEVYPLRAKNGDHELTLTLVGDAYKIAAVSSATDTITTLVAPAGYNTWVAPAGAVGYASVATNWSAGTVPTSTNNILVDGRYSTAAMIWDAPSNGLSTTVASWTQNADYTGTVTIATMYPHVPGATFTNFTVTGDCAINGGVWTHPESLTVANKKPWLTGTEIQTQECYRLHLTVGGTLTVGTAAAIDATAKGHFQADPSSDGPFYASYAGSPNRNSAFDCYGDVKHPEDIGRGTCNGSYVSHGGGAIFVTAGTAVVVNGRIAVDGGGGAIHGTAAGGAILIESPSVTGTGKVSSEPGVSGWGLCSGSGGRIALLTTNAVDLAAPTVSAGASQYTKAARSDDAGNVCGTVYLRDSTSRYGRLVVDNGIFRSISFLSKMGVQNTSVPVTAEGDWTFDSIQLGGVVNFEVPAGRTLHLPNGLSSITSSSTVPYYTALYYTGGTLDLGTDTEHVVSGNWMLCSFTNNVWPGNLTLRNGGALGVVTYAQQVPNGADPTNVLVACALTVPGDLTVESTATGIASWQTGLYQESSGVCPGYAFGAHGGALGTNLVGTARTTYGSVFNPFLPGLCQNNSYCQPGGGVVHLTVGGTLTLDADAASDGSSVKDNAQYSGAAGSLDIRCGALAGTGRIHANGLTTQAGAGGGRVAVRLMNPGATFDTFGVTNITANGSGTASGGTVYLQTADEAELAGTIYVRNVNGDCLETPLPASGAHADDVAAFKGASLVVATGAAVCVTADLQLRNVTLAEGARLNLLGHTVKIGSRLTLGGVKAPAGTYAAGDAVVAGFVTDSSGGGSVIVGGAGGFVIHICDNDLAVPTDWISNCFAAAAIPWNDVAVSNALVSTGVNGIPGWESYALGLDSEAADSVILCDAKQDASPSEVTFVARNVNPATNDAFTVSYVLEGFAGGNWEVAKTSPSNSLALSLPANYSLFRIRADIVLQ